MLFSSENPASTVNCFINPASIYISVFVYLTQLLFRLNVRCRTEKLEVDPNAHQMVDFTNIVKENEKSASVRRAPLGSNQPWWARKIEEKIPSADFVDDPEVPPLM